MDRRQIILVVSISLLVLSGYLFYSAYQLWSRYQEAVDYFRHISIPPIPTRPYPYALYIESYEIFLIPSIIAGAISLIIAITLIIHLTEKLSENVALSIIVSALVVGGIHWFYNAYQIWRRYPEATLDWSSLPYIFIPYVSSIEDYASFFIPYVIAGAVSLIIATPLFLRLKAQTSTMMAKSTYLMPTLVVSTGLLVLSGHLFYIAYQLWSQYEEALAFFQRLADADIHIIRPHYPHDLYIETYQNFFIPSIIAGVVSLIVVATLFFALKTTLACKHCS